MICESTGSRPERISSNDVIKLAGWKEFDLKYKIFSLLPADL